MQKILRISTIQNDTNNLTRFVSIKKNNNLL